MIINGKEIAQKIKDDLKIEVLKCKENYQRVPKLVVVLVGENPASQTYVRNKEKACEYIGFDSVVQRLSEDTSQDELLKEIEKHNKDDNVDGILVQLPLPKHIAESIVLDSILPSKDVDGFHPDNVARLFLGQHSLVPCTPKGMVVMLEEMDVSLEGKEVVVVGRSNIVGKPVALLCLQQNATVTIAHSKTKNLPEVCKRADILIVAVGKSKMITKEYIKPGAIVLDVGINRDENNKLCGDVDFDSAVEVAKAITPVPGGVGPMTIAMLMKNTLEAFYQRNK